MNSGAFMAIVCDLRSVQLSVHVFNGTSKIAVCEPLIDCNWSHLDSVASFLSGFRAGLQFLHQLEKAPSLLDVHYCNSPRIPCPRLDFNRDFSFLKCFSESDMNYRIYRVSDDQSPGHDQVWKFFDGLECYHIRPNLDLVRSLLDESAQCDSIGDQIFLLKYSFRQDDGGWTSNGVIGVIQRLHRLHRLCFVHGDIRKANLLLDAGYIIDFDFARPIEECPVYPDGFNSLISERHPGARPKFPMELEHDSYSLAEVLRSQGVRPTICEFVKRCEFQLAIDELSVVEEDVNIIKRMRHS
uniref:Uncharacterized protein n=1 Tax=Spongospora subterranea TaxID=70186 RepID=A0A0H5QXI2_9EUKA|eukprot:CRZ06708.1 hypothetical protein [Spongospora subterranea]